MCFVEGVGYPKLQEPAEVVLCIGCLVGKLAAVDLEPK